MAPVRPAADGSDGVLASDFEELADTLDHRLRVDRASSRKRYDTYVGMACMAMAYIVMACIVVARLRVEPAGGNGTTTSSAL